LPAPAVCCIVRTSSLWRVSARVKRSSAAFEPSLPHRKRRKISRRTLAIILAGVAIGTVGALGYFSTTPDTSEGFTEFYILGAGGEARGYPAELMVGKEGAVTAVVANREHQDVTYRLETAVNGITGGNMGPVTLSDGAKWQQSAGFTLNRPGAGQKVEFRLYRLDRDGVYSTVHLWVDAVQPQ